MNQLIFDIGSNKYEFANACRDRYPECLIVAVDPIEEFSPNSFESLQMGPSPAHLFRYPHTPVYSM